MPSCTRNVDSVEVNTQGVITVVNGYVTACWFGQSENDWHGVIDSDGLGNCLRLDPAGPPGPVRQIFTRQVADCVVIAQHGHNAAGDMVTQFAHLSSREYEFEHDAFIGAARAVRAFRDNHNHVQSISFTNTRRVVVDPINASWGKLMQSGLPNDPMYSSAEARPHQDCLLNISTFTLHLAFVTGAQCDWGNDDITDRCSGVHPVTGLPPPRGQGGCGCILS